MTARIPIAEIFGPTVQGEGPLIGRPTVFVRAGGCDYRCRWCDTLYAVLPEHGGEWQAMTHEEILSRVAALAGGRPVLVSLSGGNPALQPFATLIAAGRREGHEFALETQGSVARPWFRDLDWLILSPKPPSSGMAVDWRAFADCLSAAGAGPRIALKIVVFDDADYAFARDAAARFPGLPVYLQTGNPTPESGRTRSGDPGADEETADFAFLRRAYARLAARTAADGWFTATVLPQLHVLIWGNRRGV